MCKKFYFIIIFAVLFSTANAFAQDKKQTPPAVDKKTVAVSYGIVVDNSGSYRTILDSVVETVHNVVEENKADDETFLVRFTDASKIDLTQDFTTSKDAIHAAAEDLYIEGGLTAIYDAVNFAAKHLAENAKSDAGRRRILVLITDGEDRSSKMKIDDVLKFLKDEKIEVFTIGLSDAKLFSKNLNRLSKETGGKSVEPKTRAETASAVKELAAAMRAAQ